MSWENKLEDSRLLTTVDEVEAVVGRPASMVVLKQLKALDEGCVEVLTRSPIAGFGYRDAEGAATTFVGGRPGFARVHSPTRISFPVNGSVADGPGSLVFLLPGVGETLRVNGVARAGAEVTFDVEEVYVHCAQAVLRSGLWQPPAPAEPPRSATVRSRRPVSRTSSWRHRSWFCPHGTRRVGATPVRAVTEERSCGSWTAARS